VNALLHHCKGQLSGIGGVARPGIVHRLDKETSGCIVVAKNDAAHLALANQFAQREVIKHYGALLCGNLTQNAGEIVASIARHPSHRKRMAVQTGGREAHTSFKVIRRFGPAATLVEAVLHTGRTHQIRVHFQSLGFPLVGDATYGKRQNIRWMEETGISVSRQMLHASLLKFTHPRTGKVLEFKAPFPEDMAEVLRQLERKYPFGI
jgi:23S rRNA pseudouridine1911/1915/1917 synthase